MNLITEWLNNNFQFDYNNINYATNTTNIESLDDTDTFDDITKIINNSKILNLTFFIYFIFCLLL